jgi:hypothetical protein
VNAPQDDVERAAPHLDRRDHGAGRHAEPAGVVGVGQRSARALPCR